MTLLDEAIARVSALDPESYAKLAKELQSAVGDMKWIPSPGPQMDAYHSDADLLLYGGQAGGGKSALLTGLALTQHQRSLIMRRQYTDLQAIIEDTLKVWGTRDGFSGASPARLRADKRLIEFGAAKQPGDEEHWKGQPHDFLGIDEASQFLESQVRFLRGWVRSTDPKQRCRVVLATNPPEKIADGRWLIEWFAPWLDPRHTNPAEPGELRWYVTDEAGFDQEVSGPEPVQMGGRMVKPMSRTFIPAALSDNPFLKDSGYAAQLDALPEPLRSAVRDGNWMIAHEDDAWQLIPTNWVLAAQDRWTGTPPMEAPMCAIGVDVAQGGADRTVLAPRYDNWFAEPIIVPGKETPHGTDIAALVVKYRRNDAEIILDMGGGYGDGAYMHLVSNHIPVKGFKGSEASSGRTVSGGLPFYNKRAEAWWKFREALDPESGANIALPKSAGLLADLTAPRYDTATGKIKVEPKEDIIKRLRRSPDEGDAIVMAWAGGATFQTHQSVWKRMTGGFTTPKIIRGYANKKRRR